MFPEVMAREQAEQYEIEKNHALRLARLAGIEDPESRIDPELTATVRFGDPALAELIQQKARNDLKEEALTRLEGTSEGDSQDSLEEVDGIGPDLAEKLQEAGYHSPQDLKSASDEELLAVDGLGPSRLRQVREDLG